MILQSNNDDDPSCLLNGERISEYQNFTSFYEDHFLLTYEYAIRIVPDESLVMDSMQEMFLHLWVHRKRMICIQHPRLYLFRAVRNILYNKVKEKKRYLLFDPLLMPDEYEPFCRIENKLFRNEQCDFQSAFIKRGLSMLTKRQKEILYLHYVDGMSYKEISQLLEVPLKRVYKVSYKTMRKFKKLL